MKSPDPPFSADICKVVTVLQHSATLTTWCSFELFSLRHPKEAEVKNRLVNKLVYKSFVNSHTFFLVFFASPTPFWEGQGWRSGESAHLPPMWPEFDSGPVPCVG